jgi:acyl-CoA synthetase (NDP forming)
LVALALKPFDFCNDGVYLLVMKVHSADITHKTDAGGVRLDLRCDADVGPSIQTRCPD